METKNKTVRVTKLQGIGEYGDNHPNKINAGYIKEGIAINDLEVGNYLMVATNYKYFSTSTIKKINEAEMTFETENSIYKLEFITPKDLTHTK
jgi:hypothetical protein